MDGHLSINIYLGALANCFDRLKSKYAQKGLAPPTYHDFDYFCFHTPFSKMVQKAFYHLVLLDIMSKDGQKDKYPQQMREELAKIQEPKSEDPKVAKIL